MRSHTSSTCGIEWLMNTTAMPLSRTRFTDSSTFLVCTTPSAAVGSSRMTTLSAHAIALAMAMPCRWPPDIAPTGAFSDRTVAPSSANDAAAWRRISFSSMNPSLPRMPLRGDLPAEEHVLHGIEMRRERQVLVHHLDAEVLACRGLGQPHRLALEVDLTRRRVRGCPTVP